MTMSNTPHDDELLDALEAAIEAAQPMPSSIAELGRAAWDARVLDAEFAELVEDSLSDDPLAGVERLAIRSDTQPRLLSFAAADAAIEVEVEVEPSGRHHVVGQLLPPGHASVALERPAGGAQHARADAGGRFELAGVAPGPARMRVRREPHSLLASAWFRL
jgi:hypothetical protein